MADDVNSRLAVLEAKVAMMESGLERITRAQEQMAADVHAIRETIATGKGAWWAVGIVFGLLAAVAGGAGALMHRLIGGGH
jgi:chromosome condensin MukBEF ATPase and DNA-binding subunit MukB